MHWKANEQNCIQYNMNKVKRVLKKRKLLTDYICDLIHLTFYTHWYNSQIDESYSIVLPTTKIPEKMAELALKIRKEKKNRKSKNGFQNKYA